MFSKIFKSSKSDGKSNVSKEFKKLIKEKSLNERYFEAVSKKLEKPKYTIDTGKTPQKVSDYKCFCNKIKDISNKVGKSKSMSLFDRAILTNKLTNLHEEIENSKVLNLEQKEELNEWINELQDKLSMRSAIKLSTPAQEKMRKQGEEIIDEYKSSSIIIEETDSEVLSFTDYEDFYSEMKRLVKVIQQSRLTLLHISSIDKIKEDLSRLEEKICKSRNLNDKQITDLINQIYALHHQLDLHEPFE